MNKLQRCAAPLFAIALLQCATAPISSDSGALHPILPRTPSILPLAAGNAWAYCYRSYNALGSRTNAGEENNLAIPGVYGMRYDSTLELLDPQTYAADSDAYVEFIYQCEWEDLGRGALLAYRDRFTPVRGLYIVGEYSNDSAWLYDSAMLWLAYPADSGYAYRLGAGANAPLMEILSTRERFYCAAQTPGVSPLQFYDCYHYRETSADTVWHYYYNDDIGCLAWIAYVNDSLRVTCLLKRFSPATR